MASETSLESSDQRRSAFGFLRLLFAALVIVSHAPEILDGDRTREPLTQIFGTVSLGELSVDAFFIISGYLIAGSYLQSPNALVYLRKRVARIYPAFIVASLVTLLVVAPLAGVGIDWIARHFEYESLRIGLLQPPDIPNAFSDQPLPYTNAPMWTIAYEFRCYLLLLGLGLLGLLRHPRILVVLAGVCFLALGILPTAFFETLDRQVPLSIFWFGLSQEALRFTAIFVMGIVFYVERERIRFSPRAVVLAGLLLVGCLFSAKLAEPAIAVFGAYLIFAAASWASTRRIGKLNTGTDVSYGVYLYAWPVAQLLTRYVPGLPIAVHVLITVTIALCCGWVSWKLIERPVLKALNRKLEKRTLARTEMAPALQLSA
ncbi:acyltransferase [Sphingomonas daechungensis]|uniref:Acyltransferase n=1 Tax=Sphingomonas daechungensis TaxID=1176646 RepID=A0ABX6T0X2_9SPHN|nr:acyltransferase [Sphingomonas daechungensis]QNP43487.1 acyltransferase [Sphingomonas daechungensis]